MNDFKNLNNDYILKRSRITGTDTQSRQNNQNDTSINKSQGPSFNDVLQKIQSGTEVKFSKHAMDRLSSRNIELTESDVTRLNDAVTKASQKGVNEALILMDNKVFIASVKNRTIITAAVEDQLKDNIFTKIDGAVII